MLCSDLLSGACFPYAERLVQGRATNAVSHALHVDIVDLPVDPPSLSVAPNSELS